MNSRRIAAALITLGMATAGTAATVIAAAPATHPATGQHAAMSHNGKPGMMLDAKTSMSFNGKPGMMLDAKTSMSFNGKPGMMLDAKTSMSFNGKPTMSFN